MTSIHTGDFGVGNITGTRYFLGDMSKEGKDALIRLNKARKQWNNNNIKIQEAYKPASKSGKTVGSVTTIPKAKKWGRVQLPDPSDDYRTDDVLAALTRFHDTNHAIPLALGTGRGFAPTSKGEGLVNMLEKQQIVSIVPKAKATDSPATLYEHLDSHYKASKPFTPKKRYKTQPTKNLVPMLPDEIQEQLKINLEKNSRFTRPTPPKAQAATRQYINGIIQNINNTPGMNEAIDANTYLGNRTFLLQRTGGESRGARDPYRGINAAKVINQSKGHGKDIDITHLRNTGETRYMGTRRKNSK